MIKNSILTAAILFSFVSCSSKKDKPKEVNNTQEEEALALAKSEAKKAKEEAKDEAERLEQARQNARAAKKLEMEKAMLAEEAEAKRIAAEKEEANRLAAIARRQSAQNAACALYRSPLRTS